MAKPALNSNAHYAYRYYIDKYNLKPHQAAGIVGNLMQESTMNTGARNKGDGSDGTDSIGIGQWNGDRARALHRFAGGNVNNLDTQLDFVIHEMRNGPERAAWNNLMAADNVNDATAAMIGYERPFGYKRDNPRAGHGWDNRYAWAQEINGASPTDIARSAQSHLGSTQQPDFGSRVEPATQEVSQPTAEQQTAQATAPSTPDDRGFGQRLFDRVLGTETPEQAKSPVLGKMLPDEFMGVNTKKGINLLGALSSSMQEADAQANKQVQAASQSAQARRGQAQPVQVSMMSSMAKPNQQDMGQALTQMRDQGTNSQTKDIASLLLALNGANNPNALQDLLKKKKTGWGGSYGNWGA